jgi:hypothetical protein
METRQGYGGVVVEMEAPQDQEGQAMSEVDTSEQELIKHINLG